MTNDHHAHDGLEHARNVLKHAGYKLTNARLRVLEALHMLGGHVTSSQVIEAVSQLDSAIGRASVFRTLDLLTRLGVVRPTYVESSLTPSYVLMADGHHHHIVCIHCSRVFEFDDCGLDEIAKKLEERLKVKLMGHLLEFYGTCADCSNAPVADED
jgi:Fur family ferric uptake transcriptional regulator